MNCMPHRFDRWRYVGQMASPRERNSFIKAAALIDSEYHGAILATHDFADADGMGSIFALRGFLLKEYPSSRFSVAVDNMAASGKSLVDAMGIELTPWERIPTSDMRSLIVVDTSTPSLLNGARDRKNDILLNIDHHKQSGPLIRSRYSIINDAAISASEVAASLIPVKLIDQEMALALAVGIAGDTERLRYADTHSLAIFDSLMRISGRSKMQIDDLACPGLEPDLVLAILREMKENIHLSENYRGRSIVIASTALDIPAILSDAFRDQQVSVAATIKSTGGSLHKMSIRVLLREALRNNVHADRIARAVGERFGQHPESGGGHIDRGGAMLVGPIGNIIEVIADAIRREIDGHMN